MAYYVVDKRVLSFCKLIVAVLLSCCKPATAQVYIEIARPALLTTQHYTVYTGEAISLKSKNGSHFKNLKVIAFSDSSLVLENNRIVSFSEIKKLKLYANRPFCSFARRICIRAGILFAGLNTVNQAITGNTPIIQPVAFVIGGSIAGLGMVFRVFEYHRFRCNKTTSFKKVDTSYNSLQN